MHAFALSDCTQTAAEVTPRYIRSGDPGSVVSSGEAAGFQPAGNSNTKRFDRRGHAFMLQLFDVGPSILDAKAESLGYIHGQEPDGSAPDETASLRQGLVRLRLFDERRSFYPPLGDP
jgi:hypothetical protein